MAKQEKKADETKTDEGNPGGKAGAKPTVTFRSRYEQFNFRGLLFHAHVATTDDEALIAAARAYPRFGQGFDFWEEDPAELAAAVAAAKTTAA